VCTPAQEVDGQQELHILAFLEGVKNKTWQDIRSVLSNSLLSVADKLHWPMPVDYLAAAPEDRKAFESAFHNLLKLQTMGENLHATYKGKDVDREGLYSIQALVQPVALRFKYHFEGTRQTNRLDKVSESPQYCKPGLTTQHAIPSHVSTTARVVLHAHSQCLT